MEFPTSSDQQEVYSMFVKAFCCQEQILRRSTALDHDCFRREREAREESVDRQEFGRAPISLVRLLFFSKKIVFDVHITMR